MIVSHDQCFLDAVCTDILELRSTLAGQSKGSLTYFQGDYKTYESTLSDNKKKLLRDKLRQDEKKEKLKEFISREGRKYDNPSHQSQRKMKMKQLAQLEEIELIEEDKDMTVILPSPNGVFDHHEKLIRIEQVSFAYPNEEPLFSNIDFSIQSGARIAIMGKNGCGKTSLLNIIIGDVDPTTGRVTRHPGCRVTMLQQHHYKGMCMHVSIDCLNSYSRLLE